MEIGKHIYFMNWQAVEAIATALAVITAIFKEDYILWREYKRYIKKYKKLFPYMLIDNSRIIKSDGPYFSDQELKALKYLKNKEFFETGLWVEGENFSKVSVKLTKKIREKYFKGLKLNPKFFRERRYLLSFKWLKKLI